MLHLRDVYVLVAKHDVLLELRAHQTAHIESKVIILDIFASINANKVKLLYL